MKEAASIGIIGGADGPTAVFVAGNPAGLIAVVLIAVIAIGITVWKLMQR